MLDELALPLVAAPMAGGPSTPALVRTASAAGGLGFLAAGYKTVDDLVAEIAEVRDLLLFGVNLFVPNPVPVDPADYRRFAEVVRKEAERYGVDVPAMPRRDDDEWDAKLALLLDEPVPVVSLTFGSPGRKVVRSLQRKGSYVVQTVTSAGEALIAGDCGVDALAVQASAAGAHSGTFTPSRLPGEIPLTQLMAAVRAVTALPVVAAGGLATPADVEAVIASGAKAAMVGTVLLRSPESGASATYKNALGDPTRIRTIRTRAFTGRPARGLRNAFVDAHDAEAVQGYPAIHHLTSPVRKAAALAGDPERINIWAGTGWRHAEPRPASDILLDLASGL
jgi:nitronate monooxygenase